MDKIDYITCFTDIEFLGFPLSIYEKLKSKNINKLNDILICKLSDLEEIFTEEEINCIKERCEIQGYKLEHDYTNYGPKKKPVSIYKTKEKVKKSKKKEETDKKEEYEGAILLDAYDLSLALYNKRHIQNPGASL